MKRARFERTQIECLCGSGFCGAKLLLELGPGFLDGVEVRRVGRQVGTSRITEDCIFIEYPPVGFPLAIESIC